MKIMWLFGLAALAANLNAGHGTATGEGAPAAADVTVYVAGAGVLFDYQTRSLADRMLAAAGVRVTWRLGEPSELADALVIRVRFVNASQDLDSEGILACAYVFGVGVRDIKVSHRRVRAIAVSAGVEDYRLTAHVLVHEISHVLQRTNRHSDTGLMKARWTRADYGVMVRNTLPFTAEDVDFMRGGLAGARDRAAAIRMD